MDFCVILFEDKRRKTEIVHLEEHKEINEIL
jgi:hypothetical protein